MPAWQCLPGELAVCKDEALQSDGELHVTAAHHVLYLEVLELRLQTTSHNFSNRAAGHLPLITK